MERPHLNYFYKSMSNWHTVFLEMTSDRHLERPHLDYGTMRMRDAPKQLEMKKLVRKGKGVYELNISQMGRAPFTFVLTKHGPSTPSTSC